MPTRRARIADHFGGQLDILVHNAGVTKDRTLAKMPEDRWQSLMEVNLLAPERITEALLPVLSKDGRIVCVSSMSAIAGNAGQTNYATSKAGLLDLVERAGTAARRSDDQRRRARVHRDPDDRGDAARRARGRAGG